MFSVVDIFAGPGGLSCGFENIRDENGKKVFNLLKTVEINPFACKTLRRNFSDDAVIEGDIKSVDVKDILEKTCKKKTDILIGGPPCQSFSLIGPRSGNGHNKKDKYRYDGLYKQFIDVARRLSPKFVIFENVKGILSKQNGNETVVNKIISELHEIGYSFTNENKSVKTDYIVLNAADYGVPQLRERVFLIGNNMGIENPYPHKTHYNPYMEKNPDTNLLPYVTLFDAIADLPRIKAKKTMTHISEKEKNKVIKYNKKIYSGSDKIRYEKEWAKKHLKNINDSGKKFFNFVRPSPDIPVYHHIARQQMDSDIKLFRSMKQGMTAKDVISSTNPRIKRLAEFIRYDMNSFKDKYKKQQWKKPCSTIFAHMQKDGNRFIHPDSTQARTFTPREAARIQSFPDTFYFEGPLTIKFQQIGNAVPPILSMAIAKSLSEKLHNI